MDLSGGSPPLQANGVVIRPSAERRPFAAFRQQSLDSPISETKWRPLSVHSQYQLFEQPQHPLFAPSNRHSYHGPTADTQQYQFASPIHEESPVFPHRFDRPPRRIFHAGRSFEESSACAPRSRFSGSNFNFGLSSLTELDPVDEMSSDARKQRSPEYVEQGPEMADPSPRESHSGKTPPPAAPSGHPQHAVPHMIPQGMPMPGQVLVDPATGQHYLVPSAQPGQVGPQPLYYQPVFYQPPPPTTQQPMYYQFPQAMVSQGYPMAPMPSFQSRFAVPNYARVPQAYQTATCSTEDISGTRRTSDPHVEDSSGAPSSPLFPNKSTFGAVPPRSRPSPPNSQPEDPENSRDGFRRDVTRVSGDFVRQGSASSVDFSKLGAAAANGTPMGAGPEQQPLNPWWSRQRKAPSDQDSLTDFESSTRQRVSPPVAAPFSDSEASNRVPQVPSTAFSSAAASSTPKPTQKAVRMDIDFNKPLPVEEEEKPKPKPARAPPTAFTVTFDGDSALSLQDAARKSNSRRMAARRSAAPVQKAAAGPSQMTDEGDKHFLLDRLLHGNVPRPAALPMKDNDNVSEAGTYVIDDNDTSRTRSALITSQIVEKDSDSSSTATESSVEAVSPTKPSPSEASSSRPSSQPAIQADKRNLLQELLKINRDHNSKISTPGAGGSVSSPTTPRSSLTASASHPSGATAAHAGSVAAQKARQSLSGAAASARYGVLRPPLAPSHPASATTNASNAPSAANNFRRGDGGRFSMRTPQAAAPLGSPQNSTRQQRPPFKVGGGRPLSGNNPAQQRENEMNAWLRRKDYNPMKAAAEAKKAAQLKARADQFTSNRSISFHVGPAPVHMSHVSELSRNKSEESLAQEGASHASQRVIAEYSRGVVEDIHKLTTQHNRTTNKKEMSGLAKAVDLLSNKCKKSIELIRAQNKGCLSVSVEDLLATAMEPPRESESLTDQLDRLSNAFDAVQRYLEQYSLDDKGSSDDEDRKSTTAHSTFSAFDRRPGRWSGGPRSVASAAVTSSRPQRTTAYRSRILAQNRSPSGTRPAKNN